MVAMLLFGSGIPIRIGYDSGSPVKCLLTHPVKLDKEQYAGNMYHDLTRGLRAISTRNIRVKPFALMKAAAFCKSHG
ncbi:MAG: hypothetical protein HC888_11925 [Candidatus Competibacteraceae bacterium]|nr:hypothetical protein [Candidatus Competibacteraceae bacterium]